MPLSSGLSIHDDTKHKGSAKRDAVSGVAGIDSRGFLIAPADAFLLKRDATDNVGFRDRDTDEVINYWHRVAVDDWQMFVRSGAAFEEVQLDNMKDAANGIAGLDGSVEIPVALLKTNVANGVAGLDAGAELSDSLLPGLGEEYTIGDTTLHSHDVQADTSSLAYVKLKTITINTLYQTPKTIRTRFRVAISPTSETVYGRIYKNGGAVGIERSYSGSGFPEFIEDLSFAQGDTLELWVKSSDAGATASVMDFRVSGDETDVLLAGAIVLGAVGPADPFVGANS